MTSRKTPPPGGTAADRAHARAGRFQGMYRIAARIHKRDGTTRDGVRAIRAVFEDARPSELAEALGVSRQNVAKQLAKLGLPSRVGTETRGGWNMKTADPIARALRLAAQNAAYKRRRAAKRRHDARRRKRAT